MELIGYGAAAGVVIHALLGLLMAALPQFRVAVLGLFFILPAASLLYAWRRGVWPAVFGRLARATRRALLIWVLFLALCIAITHLQVTYPVRLPDGMYVFKRHTLNVKIQYMTSLPCDNYIPFAVTEYLLRGISFREERPLLPNNEVSNRTILMSLAALPFRASLGTAPAPKPLGKFRYVDQDWPDVERLNEDGYFQQFLIAGIFLNSLPLVGLLVLFSKLPARKVLIAGAFLYLTNPYLISETIFTWPKALAGFFILLAWNSLRSRHDPKLVALCLGLAYHSHPYAALFAVPMGFLYLWRWRNNETQFGQVVGFVTVIFLSLLPWFLWTRIYLGIPSNLIAQNLIPPQGHSSLLDLLWVRLKNTTELLSPRFFEIYPFNAALVVDNFVTCLPGAVGLFVILPAFPGLSGVSAAVRWQIVLSTAMILLVFSAPALVVLHGFQPIVGMLLFLSLAWLSKTVSPKMFRILMTLQIVCNLGIIALQGWLVDAHFS